MKSLFSDLKSPAGYRVYSPWVQIIGKRSPAAPILHMQFEHDGDLLTSVKAEVGSIS